MESVEVDTKAALLAPISTWTYWDRNLVLQSITGPASHEVAGIRSTRITDRTKDAMATAAIPDLIMSKLLADSDADAYEEWLPHSLWLVTSTIATEARDYGLSEFADIYLFVSLAMTVHPEFHKHIAVFSSERKNIAEGKSAMLDVVLEVQDEEWNDTSDAGKNLRTELCNTAYATLMNEKSTGF